MQQGRWPCLGKKQRQIGGCLFRRGRVGSRVGTLGVAEVGKPGAAVELGVDGLDLVGTEGGVGGRLDEDGIKTLHLLRRLFRDPSDDDGITGVPHVEDLEWNRGLRSLGLDESVLGRKGEAAELGTRHVSQCTPTLGGLLCNLLLGVTWCLGRSGY